MDKKMYKLERARGLGWIIYFSMTFAAILMGFINYDIATIIFGVHLLGGFLWLPKVYGFLYSKLLNRTKLTNMNIELDDLCNEFYNTTGISYEYMTVPALEKIERLIRSGRVETLKEAYSLMEEEMHREELINLQQQQHKESIKELRKLKDEIEISRYSD